MEGYDYKPSTGTYVRNTSHLPNHFAPPLPPKELGLVKETHSASEIEANSDAGDSITYSEPRTIAPLLPSTSRRRVRILSLDGGGIRGYSSLVILGELMHQVYVHENNGKPPASPADVPRPCDYFDLIGGNGTGGLLALMLGRMRMDVESCKSYYVSLTRFVFITDKTLLGMPYGKTLFKASRLEEAIRHCVRESTRFDSKKIVPHSPPPAEPDSPGTSAHKRTDSWRRRRASGRSDSVMSEERGRTGWGHRQIGNPEAPLLDNREGACKTFVTAMMEGSRKGTPPVLLRSYPSPAESTHSYRTAIWQAGRATCATASAFKSITIDQTTFLDEGAGLYNPAFQVLDEAHIHEFPDCDIGLFVSVGTGKRPQSSNTLPGKREWWEGVAFEGFAEAKRRLIRRIDDCERVHRELVDGIDGGRPRLAQGGVSTQDYYRFNAEVGVGEFGMNEWNRLAEVATGTRRYLSGRETNRFVKECAGKMVSIELSGLGDGTRIKFKPSAKGKGDEQMAELPAGPPDLKNHPFYLHQRQEQEQERERQRLLKEQERLRVQQQQQHRRPLAVTNPQLPPQPAAVMPDEKIFTYPTHSRPPAIHQLPQQQPPQQHQQYPQQYPQSQYPQSQQRPPQQQPQTRSRASSSSSSRPTDPQVLPLKPSKPGKVLVASTTEQQNYYADDIPNPEIRLTSPTTVAGGSDNEEDEDMYTAQRRRRRKRSRSRSRSMAGVIE